MKKQSNCKTIRSKFNALFNRTPFWIQIMVLTVLTTTCIIFILIYHNYTSIRNQSIQNQITLSSKLLHMESENMDQYLMMLANFCIQPYYDSEFTRIINQKGDLTADQLSYIRQQMYYYYYSRNDLMEYELYLVNQDTSIGRTINQQHMTIQPAPTFDVEKVTQKCSESMRNHYIEAAQSPAFFTYYHSLFQIKGKKIQSIVRLQLNTSYLKQFLENHSDKNEIFVFLTEDGEFIYSNHNEVLGNAEQMNTILETKKNHRSQYDTVKIADKRYILIEAESQSTHLKLLCFTPISYIDAQFEDIQSRIITIGILIWCIAIVLSYMLVKLLTMPLKTLAAQMQKTGHGDFDTLLHEGGSLEVVELSDSYNLMVSEINDLIKRTYVAELSEKDAQLIALEAQINPHFLYNTLQAISTEALINDQPQIHRMITSLASNLRYTIKDAALVSLRREMEYVSNYIFLQKTRMDDALTFHMEIEAGTEDFLIPKISVHTLVENSIIHGINKSNGQIEICVTTHYDKEENTMIIQVADNGCGIAPERLKTLQENLTPQINSDYKNSIGLTNLYIRLQLLYEKPALMQIESQENEFTRITLTLPAIKEKTYV